MTTTLTPVKVNSSLKAFINEKTLINNIVTTIQAIPDYTTLKNDIALIEHVLQLIQNSCLSSDITNICIKIITTIFPDIDIPILTREINFLISTGVIKSIPLLKRYYKSIKKFVLKSVSP